MSSQRNRRPGPLLPVPDRHPARRPDPHRPVQLGARPPPRRHLRVPHRGHRRQPRLRGVLRRAARRAALARPRLGRGPRGRRPARAVPAERARASSTPTRCGRLIEAGEVYESFSTRGGDRGAPPGGRPRPQARLRQRRPRPHRGAAGGVPRRGPRAGATGCGCPTATSPSTDLRPRRDHLQGRHRARLRARPRRRHPALPADQPARRRADGHHRRAARRGPAAPPPRARSRCSRRCSGSGSATGRSAYGHLPLVTGEGNRKLSKRDPQSNLFLYRERGFVPEGLLNYLALLGWSIAEDRDVFTMDEMVDGVRHLPGVEQHRALRPEEGRGHQRRAPAGAARRGVRAARRAVPRGRRCDRAARRPRSSAHCSPRRHRWCRSAASCCPTRRACCASCSCRRRASRPTPTPRRRTSAPTPPRSSKRP